MDIRTADDKAHAAFLEMLQGHDVTGRWIPELVDAYLDAERNVDLAVAVEALDEVIAADTDYWAGDHFVYERAS